MEPPKGTQPANRLIHSKSPYLLQHAHNLVDWYPWGDEAFDKASKENKPVFLSIGYSTCHWCHVMAHESFEDPEVASLMNETFVSIKVDREERPDLDHVYMTVCQMMTGGGGWPLTVLLTPDKKPFYAGTYIPKKSRFGHLGMLDFIPRIREIWLTRSGEVLGSAERLSDEIRRASRQASGGEPDRLVIEKGYIQLSERFDRANGGFGSAPKFPSPHQLFFLLRYWSRTQDPKALHMVEKTLQSMRSGGIYDQIGFGFHRYSVDGQWRVPHFEKMLYDQALIAMAYIEAYQAARKPVYAQTAREIFEYVLRDLTDPAGGFYSSEDADSEGEEGRFYLWTTEEIKKSLTSNEAEAVLRRFHLEESGNFFDEAAREKTGRNILYLSQDDLPLQSDSAFAPIRKKLFDARSTRIHPHKDDKILTDWNGLMIAALAKGGQVFGEPRFLKAAEKAADFILERLVDAEGALFHRFRENEAAVSGFLNDYAFMIWGLLELYESSFDDRRLAMAARLNERMLAQFWDEENGGLFFTSKESESVLFRHKEIYDGAIPSGNSAAFLNFLRLSLLTEEPRLEEKALAMSRAFSNAVTAAPMGYSHFLSGLLFSFGPAYRVTLRGNPRREDLSKMADAIRKPFIPNKAVKLVYAEEAASAAVCEGKNCRLPTADISQMLKDLGAESRSGPG